MDQPNPLPPAVMGYGKYEQRCQSGCPRGYGGQGQGMTERGASLTLACRRPPIAYAPPSLRLSAAPEAWRSAAKAALYALLEKRGIIRLSTWRSRRPGSCEKKLGGLCWGLIVLPLIRT